MVSPQSDLEPPDSSQGPRSGEDLLRRQFIESAGGGLVGLGPIGPAAAGGEAGAMGQGSLAGLLRSFLGICQTTRIDPEFSRRQGSSIRVRVGVVPELQGLATAVYLGGGSLENPVLLLRRDEDHYLAFSNRCTHMGRRINPVPGQEVLRCCSVSHSLFDLQGRVVAGPAERRLTVYPTKLESGELVVTLPPSWSAAGLALATWGGVRTRRWRLPWPVQRRPRRQRSVSPTRPPAAGLGGVCPWPAVASGS
jgi:nitrite reductase/ring-hydroxylating ferredoxin subunit